MLCQGEDQLSKKMLKIKNLAIAYYNLGLEEEYFSHNKAALNWFKKGHDVVSENFPKDNPLVQKLKDTVNKKA